MKAPTASFLIPVTWEQSAVLRIEATSLRDAIRIVEHTAIILPAGKTVGGSLEVDYGKLVTLHDVRFAKKKSVKK